MTELRVTAPRAPAGGWRRAIVREVAHPTPDGVALRLEVPERVDHWPGQHYVVRLTAEDGYVAQRSYSVVSAPADPLLELFVERLPDGEVSGYLADVVEPGDVLDVRGPIGGWFVWRAEGPALGIGGGSGVVPFVSMLRHALYVGRAELLSLAVSARTAADLPYAGELAAHGALIALTRADALDNGRARGRLTPEELAPLLGGTDTSCFVCGSAVFAEAASGWLTAAGVDAGRIRVERFGPTN